LSTSIESDPKSFEKDLKPEAYTSVICSMFMSSLSNCPNPQILDVGPVCGENIMFFGERVKRLYVCDLYARLNISRKKKIPLEKLWQVLDYPEQSFDGILLWDLLDRLDNDEAMMLVKLCRKLIRPRGTVMLAAYARQTFLSNVNAFIMGKAFNISFRPQKHLELYSNYRHNRDIMNLFAPLSLVKAQINKNGYREFLLQRLPD